MIETFTYGRELITWARKRPPNPIHYYLRAFSWLEWSSGRFDKSKRGGVPSRPVLQRWQRQRLNDNMDLSRFRSALDFHDSGPSIHVVDEGCMISCHSKQAIGSSNHWTIGVRTKRHDTM